MKRIIILLSAVLILISSCKDDKAMLLPTKEVSFETELKDTLVGTPIMNVMGAQNIYSYDSLLFVEGRDPMSQLGVYSVFM